MKMTQSSFMGRIIVGTIPFMLVFCLLYMFFHMPVGLLVIAFAFGITGAGGFLTGFLDAIFASAARLFTLPIQLLARWAANLGETKFSFLAPIVRSLANGYLFIFLPLAVVLRFVATGFYIAFSYLTLFESGLKQAKPLPDDEQYVAQLGAMRFFRALFAGIVPDDASSLELLFVLKPAQFIYLVISRMVGLVILTTLIPAYLFHKVGTVFGENGLAENRVIKQFFESLSQLLSIPSALLMLVVDSFEQLARCPYTTLGDISFLGKFENVRTGMWGVVKSFFQTQEEKAPAKVDDSGEDFSPMADRASIYATIPAKPPLLPTASLLARQPTVELPQTGVRAIVTDFIGITPG